ncbi:UDP-glucose 4-epimerase GalE [Acuticoccus kandeliae]|uniref:UDP-glucose 4-epimerase GalE n=1 Tax=Acuticoccus kandeliae TaxID=2073160 RepID=UPI000D3ED62F|nr:UDP-glucose 4-epimerase GalE [Acuticoccus kandeliae]
MAVLLVTGGAGYIGAHVAKALALARHRPVVYDNLSRGHRYAVRWGPLAIGDINDADRLDAVFRTYRPAAVLHFAASSEVSQSVRDPIAYWRNNVAGSLTLIERALANGVDRFVFSSTCAIYGTPAHIPLAEDSREAPINPYGETKLAVERLLRSAAAAYGLNAVALRYFNAAGASQTAEIGENHVPETHLVPLVLDAALDPTRSIAVFGTDYPTPDGSCIRDYVHVDDLASAHILAVEQLLRGGLTGFVGLNLGSGRGYSVLEIVKAARRITGAPITVTLQPRRAGDPAALVADATQARRVLGWEPGRSDIGIILRSAWRWSLRKDELSASELA